MPLQGSKSRRNRKATAAAAEAEIAAATDPASLEAARAAAEEIKRRSRGLQGSESRRHGERERADLEAKTEAERKKRIREAGRRGRRGTILTGARGIEDELGLVNRPRAATLLGQTMEF